MNTQKIGAIWHRQPLINSHLIHNIPAYMPTSTGEQSLQPYTHIINVKGSQYAYFASEVKDDGTSLTFVTYAKDGRKFKRTVAKDQIADMAEEVC